MAMKAPAETALAPGVDWSFGVDEHLHYFVHGGEVAAVCVQHHHEGVSLASASARALWTGETAASRARARGLAYAPLQPMCVGAVGSAEPRLRHKPQVCGVFPDLDAAEPAHKVYGVPPEEGSVGGCVYDRP
jgi:hypothetical protein